MVKVDILHAESPNFPCAVEAAAQELGLSISTRSSLASFPGSTHWHLKRPGSTGTLEVTWAPAPGRAWVSYHANRIGDGWVTEAASDLAAQISAHLSAGIRD